MGTDVYQGSAKVGSVSTSGEVYYASTKIGWVNRIGDMYLHRVYVGCLSREGDVFDKGSYKLGRVDSQGHVHKGTVLVGQIEPTLDRCFLAGAALLLLFHCEAHPAP